MTAKGKTESVLSKRKSVKEVKIKYKGRTFGFHPSDERIRKEMIESGTFYELPMLQCIEKINRRGLYIDCGAAFLNHTTFFADFCPSDAVIAIDPIIRHDNISDLYDRSSFGLSAYFYRVLKPIFTYKAAVGAYLTTAEIVRSEHEGSTSVREITSDNEVSPENKVNVTTVDTLVTDWMCQRILDLNNNLTVAVIKIDVEGYEWNVLQGARQTIAKWKPELFIEIWEQRDLVRITQWLSEFGYEMKERYNHAPTYHFSCDKSIPVTYTPPK